MDTRHFETALGDLAAILGDPTRRGIYLAVEASGPTTVTAIAGAFDLHPNVARHHLERLVEEGYLEEAEPPAGGEPHAGRPPRHYRATGKETSVSHPPRRFDLLSELLVQVVERLDPGRASSVAEEVGFRFGAQLAAEIGLTGGHDAQAALQAVSGALETIGFGMAPDPADRSLLTSHCPFGKTAADHPEIVCRIDQGIVRGLMDAAGGAGPVVVTPHDGPDDACVTAL
ncbi:MAG: helix-turn-helix domain-containing protein [Actinobacteria bacterium]|nr:helix-turn-helix domain-containing protein [Actinomycetota bacterium]